MAASPDVPAHLRKDVSRLASGQRIIEMTDPVLGSDFANALLSYKEAGGSVEQDFSPEWAALVIRRVLAGIPGKRPASRGLTSTASLRSHTRSFPRSVDTPLIGKSAVIIWGSWSFETAYQVL